MPFQRQVSRWIWPKARPFMDVHCDDGTSAAPRSLNRVCDASSVCRMLRPAGGRIFELLLAAVGRCIEQHARIAVMLGATRVRRIGVKHLVTACEEDAQPMLFAE